MGEDTPEGEFMTDCLDTAAWLRANGHIPLRTEDLGYFGPGLRRVGWVFADSAGEVKRLAASLLDTVTARTLQCRKSLMPRRNVRRKGK